MVLMPLLYIAHQQLCRPPDDLVPLAPASMADCAAAVLLCFVFHCTQGEGTSEKKSGLPGPLTSGVLILVSRVRDSESGGLLVGGRNLVLRGVVWLSIL